MVDIDWLFIIGPSPSDPMEVIGQVSECRFILEHHSASVVDGSLDTDMSSSLKDNSMWYGNYGVHVNFSSPEVADKRLVGHMSRFYGKFSYRKPGVRL